MVLELRGTITAGLGEGSYYVKEYSAKIERGLGFKPFFGTLNILLNSEVPDMRDYVSQRIETFRNERKEFGRVEFIPARIFVGESAEECYIVLPEKSKHFDEIELISEFSLRKKLGLNTGDGVRIEID